MAAQRNRRAASLQRVYQPAGVLDSDLAPVPHGDNWVGHRPTTTPPNAPKSFDLVEGNHLYGGVLKDHFGHALTEGIARFWALGQIDPSTLDSIVFIPKKRGEEPKVLALLKEVISHLGLSVPVRIQHAPAQFERLCVPGQGYGLGQMAIGTREHRNLFQKKFARDVPADTKKKIYLSRSGLGQLNSGAHNEDELEGLLEAQGYHIFHPQDHNLSEQIYAIKGAERVLGLEGSAFHLVSLVNTPNQKVGIISRDLRNPGPADMMRSQIEAMGKTKFSKVYSSYVAFHRPDSIKRGVRLALATLDLNNLGSQLENDGFLEAAFPHVSSEDALKATELFISDLSQTFKKWVPKET